MQPAPQPADRVLPGVALMLAFCVTAPLLDVSAKLAAATIPTGQITAARFIGQGLIMLPVALAMGVGLALPRALWGMVTLRAALLLVSTYCFVFAVRVMPIADALAIVFVAPFILMIAGKLLFGDAVGPRRLVAALVGFAGALLVIQPGSASFGSVVLFPLGTAVTFAFYMLVTRQMAPKMHPVAMQLHTSLAGALLCLPLLAVGAVLALPTLAPVWPAPLVWVWLAGVGLWACVSHMCMTYALSFAPSATLAPLQYFEIVAAVVLGYLVFGDFPNTPTWAGIITITASGLYVIHRERVNARGTA